MPSVKIMEIEQKFRYLIENNWTLATCDRDFSYIDGLSIKQW